jgi:hypothetical protein
MFRSKTATNRIILLSVWDREYQHSGNILTICQRRPMIFGHMKSSVVFCQQISIYIVLLAPGGFCTTLSNRPTPYLPARASEILTFYPVFCSPTVPDHISLPSLLFTNSTWPHFITQPSVHQQYLTTFHYPAFCSSTVPDHISLLAIRYCRHLSLYHCRKEKRNMRLYSGYAASTITRYQLIIFT